MRIAQVAPLYESVPPKQYGGTERVVSYLTEELVRQGHDVTLFASGDSETSATLVPCCDEGLRLSGWNDSNLINSLMLDKVWTSAADFDVIHFHTDFHYPVSRRLGVPTVTTLHGRLDLREFDILFRELPDVPVIAISDNQIAQHKKHARCVATIHHGLPPDLYPYNEKGGEYLVFIGRISPEKRPDLAIQIARETGLPLRIAAKVSNVDTEYYEKEIRPLLRGSDVAFIGEVDDAQKAELLGGALAMLFPIQWPEPFGLVMIESMACGTPIIAFPYGSVPEVIDHGRSGFIVDSVAEAVDAVKRVQTLSRSECRACFTERFTVQRMTEDYLQVYGRLCDRPYSRMRVLSSGVEDE